ncbi:hypothetical protein [Corynebacterium cystitidis]|uniref:hypothetical protein n=1 Tax=Corynebacterium cystitidis TaxID=35757 RepID=UPI00211E3C25|nr:hypothetical protein [Corynebacterium cystitidis]
MAGGHGMAVLRGGFGAALVGMLTVGLTGCGAADHLAGETFQVVSVYLEPNSPDELPASAAGAARLVIGESTMTGSTGCAPLQAAVVFSDSASGKEVARDDADLVRVTNVEFRDPGDCDGGRRFVHNALEVVLTAETDLRIDRLSGTELILTKQTGEINQPAIRLMAQ